MNGTESYNVYQRKKNKEQNTENCELKSLYYPKQLQEFLTFKNDRISNSEKIIIVPNKA